MLNQKSFNHLKYLEYIPDDTLEKYPLIIYLHGAGERGEDLSRVNVHGPIKEMLSGKIKSEFLVIAPQCGENKTWWDYSETLYEFVLQYIKQPFVDTNRIYLTGNSMGGFGTWSFAMAHPELFAAIIPICGGGYSWNAGRLKQLNVWGFHCVGDGVVPCANTIDMITKVKDCSEKDVKLTIFTRNSHDAWTEVYQDPKVYDWLLSCKK